MTTNSVVSSAWVASYLNWSRRYYPGKEKRTGLDVECGIVPVIALPAGSELRSQLWALGGTAAMGLAGVRDAWAPPHTNTPPRA